MIFPKGYFQDEIREGFLVPEMMKRAWAAALEVLEVIKDICRENGLVYYAAYGTLLGTIRHKGFIPWDDDIDIYMFRNDYDRFIEIADTCLPEGFVLSGIYGKNTRLWGANSEPQLRVIADEKYFTLPSYMNRFHSYPYMRIGIDIFPLDNVPEDVQEQYEIVKLSNDIHFIIANWELLRENGELEDRIAKTEKMLGVEYLRDDENLLKREMRLYADRLAASCEDDTGKVADILYCMPPGERDKFTGIKAMRSTWFGKGVSMLFENTQITVPEQYKEVLRVSVGEDYMIPKPFTADHEYPFYKTQEKAFIKLLRDSGIDSSADEFCRNWHKINDYK